MHFFVLLFLYFANNLNCTYVMKDGFSLTILFVAIITLVGCTQTNPILIKTNNLIETNPKKALFWLENIDKENLSDKDMAFYALLYTEAQINNGLDIASDSLISIALNYYSPDDALRMRALLCKAQLSKLNHDYSSAMISAMNANYIAQQLKDKYWTAKSCGQISSILFNTHHYKQAAQYMRKSIEYYQELHDVTAQRKAISNLARIYLNNGNAVIALSILDSLKNICVKEPQVDNALINYIEAPRLIAFISTANYTHLTEKEMDLIAEDNSDFSLVSTPLIVTLHSAVTYHSESKIDTLLHKITNNRNKDNERFWSMYALYEQAKKQNDYSAAVSIADSIMKLRNDVFANSIEEPVIEIQRNFIEDKLIEEKHKSNQRSLIIITVITMAVIAIVAIIVIYRLRMRLKRQQIEIYISEINALHEQIHVATSCNTNSDPTAEENPRSDESNKLKANQIEIIRKLFTSRWQTINALCEDYIANKGESEGIFKNIEREIKFLQSQTNFDNLELAINKFNNGAMEQCREDLPGLKESDYNMFTLLMLGLTPRTISIFLNIQPQNFYLRRRRLRAKLKEFETIPNIEYYVNLLK